MALNLNIGCALALNLLRSSRRNAWENRTFRTVCWFRDLIKPGGLLISTVNGAGAVLEAIYAILFIIYAPKANKVWKSYEAGDIVQLIDRKIIENCDEKQALRCIQVGILCTQAESQLRPPMSTVTLMLSTDSSMHLPDPTKPACVSSYVSQNTSSGLPHASATASSSCELPAHTPCR